MTDEFMIPNETIEDLIHRPVCTDQIRLDIENSPRE